MAFLNFLKPFFILSSVFLLVFTDIFEIVSRAYNMYLYLYLTFKNSMYVYLYLIHKGIFNPTLW